MGSGDEDAFAPTQQGKHKGKPSGQAEAQPEPPPRRPAGSTFEGRLSIVDPSRFSRIREVARGGIGCVTEAWDKRLNRPVALKEVLGNQRDQQARFLREAEITARLQHPHIVPIHDVGFWPDGAPFYSMRLVTGDTLAAIIMRCKDLRQRMVYLPNVIAVAEAIAYAHSQGIIHRDLKPSNILVGSFGETVLIDWGLAKEYDEAEAKVDIEAAITLDGNGEPGGSEQTAMGAVMGTPAFMSPEQARGERVDPRTDVYSLGAILYDLLGGAAPFRDSGSDEILKRVKTGRPSPLEALAPEVPSELVTIVDKAMQYDRAERYTSMEALLAELNRYQNGQLVVAHRYSGLALLRRWVRRHQAPVLVAAVLMTVLALVTFLAFRRITKERDAAESRNNDLTLLQARSAVLRDPTEAVAWIKSLPANAGRWNDVRMSAMEAQTKGVARHVWRGHGSPVFGLAVAPDGRTIASAGLDRTARLWSLDSDRSLAVLAGHTKYVTAVAFSKDGRTVATSSGDGTIRLWDRRGSELRVLASDAGHVTSIAFSPDGATLVSGALDKTVHLWDLASAQGRALTGHTASVVTVSYSPKGDVIASAAIDGSIILWDASGTRLALVQAGAGLRALALSSDGALLAAAGDSGIVWVWDVASRAPVGSLRHRGVVRSVAFSADGHSLATGGADGVRLWSVPSLTEQSLEASGAGVNQVAFSADSRLLAAAGADGAVRVWWLEEHGEPMVLLGHRGAVHCVAFAGDGRTVVSGADDGAVRVWRPERPVRVLHQQGAEVPAVAFSPDGARVLAGLLDGQALVIDLAGGETKLPQAGGPIADVKFSPDGSSVATCSWDGLVRVTTAQGGELRALALDQPCTRVLYSPDGRSLVASGEKGEVRLWSTDTWASRPLTTHGGNVVSAAFSPDGAELATASFDQTVRVVEVASGRTIFESRRDAHALDVTFSGDASQLATAWGDGKVRVYDLPQGRERTLSGHVSFVDLVLFSPSSATLASAGADNNVWLWDLRHGFKRPLGGHTERLRNLVFLRDGSHLVTVAMDDTMRLWDLASGHNLVLARLEGGHGLAVAPDGVTVAAGGAGGKILLWKDQFPADRDAIVERLDSMTDLTVDTIGSVPERPR